MVFASEHRLGPAQIHRSKDLEGEVLWTGVANGSGIASGPSETFKVLESALALAAAS